MAVQTGTESLFGKRILLVEEDDRLYCALKDALRAAGCETIGLPAHFPDVSAIVPGSHVDAALVDISWSGRRLSAITRQLDERSVPIPYIGTLGTSGLPVRAPAAKPLRRPFTEQELLDGMLETINSVEPAHNPDSTAEASPTIKVLQVTCSHCGHMREFHCDEHLTAGHLEAVARSACSQCDRLGFVFGFFAHSPRPNQALESLPTILRLVGQTRFVAALNRKD